MLRTGNQRLTRTLAVPLLVCVFLLLSCGTSNNTASSDGALSGNWQVTLQQNPPSSITQSESGFLVQSGDSLSGQLVLSGQTHCAGLGSVQGTLTKSNIGITVNQIGQTVNLAGTAASDGSSMAGTYSTFASGCSDGSSTGTWIASPVKPVTGTYAATFTSYTLGVYGSVITVTQGPNTGASVATLSGTMTLSNAPCGNNNVSVSGVVGGTSIVFNFLTSDGSAVGQFRGSTSNDAKTLTGTYDFLAQGNVCDAGTISAMQQSST